MRTLVLFASLALAAAAAQAETRLFHYRVTGLQHAGDCHDLARRTGATFAAVTGVTPEDARCTDISPAGQSLDITYRAETPLRLVSTDEGFANDGVYAALEDCQADLGAEAEHFTQVTGLTPVVAACQRLGVSRDRPFIVLVDSFGDTRVEPRTAWTALLDRPVDLALAELTERLAAALTDRGIDVRSALVTAGFFGDLYVRYYAAERLVLENLELAALRSIEQCREQLQLAEGLPYQTVTPPLVTYCARSAIGTYYVKSLRQDRRSDGDFLSAERFESYDACMVERAALIAAYDARRGDVGGGLCTDSEGAWRVRLVRR